ncbi:cytochrome c oxidase assembly factor CtaG [Longirhabdus pacifica]|uniref:cytochrome c oxidase assembly factor CtaG n=1 Tax=Longirhabdus pacifica TaxID=2305227 RepID=UPI001008E7BD|nr:cytochrome c oxidase assembly factor CtaG [Longirhabdus pacifica]
MMFGLEYFSFSAVWSPYVMISSLALIVLYLLITGPWRHKFKNSEPVPLRKKMYFIIGIAIFYFAQGGPLDLLAHLMFSAHMISMSVKFIILPPIILLSIPAWFYQAVFRASFFKKLSFIVHPIFTAILFNGLFSFYHIPIIHDAVMTNYSVHTIYLIILYISAFLMFWPVMNPLPDTDTLSGLKKTGYMFLNGALITPACALIIFSPTALYTTFTDPAEWAVMLGYCVPLDASTLLANFSGPEYFTNVTPLEDQQIGGVAMKLVQEFVYAFVLASIFAQWFRKESKKDKFDVQDKTSSLTNTLSDNRA